MSLDVSDLEESTKDLRRGDLGKYVRDISESLEESNSSNKYTQELESFLENVYEPVLYHELERAVDENSDLEENPLHWKERYDRDIEDLEREMEYWEERLDCPYKRTGELIPFESFIGKFEELDECESLEIESVAAPVVGGIDPGIIARDILDAEIEYLGFGEESTGGSRSVSFSTFGEGEVEGDVLIVDDTIVSGGSSMGVYDSLEPDVNGQTLALASNKIEPSVYEVIGSKPGAWWLAENIASSDERYKPDELMRKTVSNYIKMTDADPMPLMRETAKKTAAYSLPAGIALMGLSQGSPEAYSKTFVGAALMAGELHFNLVSEALINPAIDYLDS
jgi:hypothetical protein